MSTNDDRSCPQRLAAALEARFGRRFEVDEALPGLEELTRIAEHRSHRRYTDRPIAPSLLELLFACALSAPSKSDLQQADIIHVADRAKIRAIAGLIPDMPWIADAPVFLVFCANNRRLRQIAQWRAKPYVNDHLDHFMNAAVDAGIVLTSFLRAAEAVGLGCCPVSAVRNRPHEVSGLLELPDWVFPVAGLTLGYPAQAGMISPRLPLSVTVHTDRYGEARVREEVEAYDRRRHAVQPYRRERHTGRYGETTFYGWSEDKARQYSVPERADFGSFIRSKRFRLD
jgi:nitroreductase